MSRFPLLLALFLCPAYAASAQVPVDSPVADKVAEPTTSEAARVSGLTGKELVEFNATMDELRGYDTKTFGKGNVSVEKAKRMTTEELIMQTCRQDLWLLGTLHPDHPKIALYRASRCSNAMTELLGRKDFAPVFIQAYSSFDPHPKTNKHFEDEGAYFATGWMLSLLGYPSLRNQMAGHEKQVILVLCKKYREVKKVNASYPKGQAPYSMPFAGLGVVQHYAKKLFPKARILSIRMETDKGMETAVRELERLCGS